MRENAYMEGLVQGCSNSNALAMELRQSYAEPSIYFLPEINSAGKELIYHWVDTNL